jgi:cytochrome oxidase assembly protein ShyY1
LVALIANGYRALAWVLLAVYVLPLLTLGAWQLWRNPAPLAVTAR